MFEDKKPVVSSLDFSERARLLTLYTLLQRLRKEDESALKEMSKCLSKYEMEDFKGAILNQRSFEKLILEKPDEVQSYEKYLSKADRTNALADRIMNKRNYQRSKIYRRKAEKEYETALGHLQELSENDPTISMYFDRELDFSPGGLLGPDCVSVPRHNSSKSRYNRHDGTKTTKVEIAISYIELYLDRYNWSQ